jgi:hypothetical protein
MKLILGLLSIMFLLNEAQAQAASRSYKSIASNDDGRVTITGPFFKYANGESYWISASSDLTGVCKLYGFSKAVPNGSFYDPNAEYERTVVINSAGQFSQYGFPAERTGYSLQHVMCETGKVPTASQRLEQEPYLNDDGTITLRGPSFASANGKERWISSDSNLNGVCLLYGYGAAVKASLVTYGEYALTVIVGSNGKFESTLSNSETYYNSRIYSLICRPIR